MTSPSIRLVQLGGAVDRPLLVLGPSLGSSAQALWGAAAAHLAADFHVVGWELPGHGRSTGFDDQPFTMAELTEAVLAAVSHVSLERGSDGEPFHYAGCSIGGAVGLQLALDAPQRLRSVVSVCSAAKFGESESWQARAETVREQGTPAVLTSSAERWFAPGFTASHPEVSDSLLAVLQHADRFAYARTCEALANFDIRERLGEITTPLLAIAGGHDHATPVADSQLVAMGVARGELRVAAEAAHLAPAEVPDEVAALIGGHARPLAEQA